MSRLDLGQLIHNATAEMLGLLAPERGPVEPPIRSEIFGPERFAQHGRSLSETHRAEARSSLKATFFFPRLRDNVRVLREAHRFIGSQVGSGHDVSSAAEWFLDNFHLIDVQLQQIYDGLSRRDMASLPALIDEPLRGLPRIYGVAWAFVSHTDGAFDEAILMHFLTAYQETRELTLGELWALSPTMRVVLVENLRRLAESMAANQAARAVANLCCDRIDFLTLGSLDEIVHLLQQRGVARVFLAQMAERLIDPRSPSLVPYHEWLARALPDLAAIQTQQPTDQAADNLSVRNAIGSLRLIANADWPEIVSRTSATMKLLLASKSFEAERDDTREQALQEVRRLARHSGRSEREVAQTLLDLMQPESDTPRSGSQTDVTRYWLFGPGRAKLLSVLGLDERWTPLWKRFAHRAALPTYLGSLVLGTTGLIAWLLLQDGLAVSTMAQPWLRPLAALLMMFPASEAVIAAVNWLISDTTRPSRLPRLALAHGIPADHRVIVVIPGMLTSEAAGSELTRRLELHYLANSERHAQFALLTDWADAEAAVLPTDAQYLDAAVREVTDLNARHPVQFDAAPRFIVLHRPRVFSQTERRWIGWERKRGKIEQLIDVLAEPDAHRGTSASFIDIGEFSRVKPDTRYVVTLDADMRLPPDQLRDLVGVAAHPLNQPVVDTVTRTVRQGYGILQPRIVTPLPSPRDATLSHWLFAGQCTIDPHTVASSKVYQDLFSEGTFTGNGLLNVSAMHAVLSQRLPDGQLLGHDLLEGSLVRCASVTDIVVMKDAAFRADVGTSRRHRQMRGDWQLLPILLQPKLYGIRAINRWKMIDNLRHSLVAPMSLGTLVLSLATGVIAPSVALLLVLAAFCVGPMLGAVGALVPNRDEIAKWYFYRLALTDLARASCSGAWLTAQLLQLALTAFDAVLRALWRVAVSKRHLLEWTTEAVAQPSSLAELAAIARKNWGLPLVAALLLAGLLTLPSLHPVLSVLLCGLWASSPAWTWWLSRPRPAALDASIPPRDRTYLEGLARDTWRLFERCVGPEDNHLPPDNLQVTPHTLVAHRTSPTNVGLYMLSAACARQFGWIGTQDLLARLEAVLDTLDSLQRYRGHFFSWYDTQSSASLLPMYVSTVDSGNFSSHLLAVAQACIEFARAPFDDGAARRAVAASAQHLLSLRVATPDVIPDGPLAQLVGLANPLLEAHARPVALEELLRGAAHQLSGLLPPDDELVGHSPADEVTLRAADHVATVRSVLLDAMESRLPIGEDLARRRLLNLAHRCEALAWQPDFGFLYHPKRRLLHTGFSVAEHQLDESFHVLLASESRLASLFAIAKGDVPVAHWATLGRPFYAVGPHAGLRSWSGSMCEYLMPSLVLSEPRGSVLNDACRAALLEQIHYSKQQKVPWGISESCYAASDEALAYQYAAQGVPRLALRRTPVDELVIAPYATALAAQIAPVDALANFSILENLRVRGRYGLIEALDYSPARQLHAQDFTRVETFKAHHQGMSIVALANVLLDCAPRRWGMGNPRVQAVESLLHERAPREVSQFMAPISGTVATSRRNRSPGMVREVLPGASVVEPTHLLSNGRYTISLRPNGAGWSRWGLFGISSWRDDAEHDALGTFFHLRWDRQPRAVSVTQHPAPDTAAQYRSSFHADRVCFDAAWAEIASHVKVWVSAEDDVEFRQIELRNLSERTIDVELMSSFEPTLVETSAEKTQHALTAKWQAANQALVFERKQRLAREKSLLAAHFIADSDAPPGAPVQVQTNRLRWRGRDQDTSQPHALFDTPVAPADGADGVLLDTGADPLCALAQRFQLAPNAKVQFTFCTAVSDEAQLLEWLIDKYRYVSPIERASLMSTTLTGIRLRELGVGAETFAAIQMLSTALVMSVTQLSRRGSLQAPADVCDRRLLFRFGVSGDRPIVLITARAEQSLGLVRSLGMALRVWDHAGVACDLVVLNAEPNAHLMRLHSELEALRDHFVPDTVTQKGSAGVTGFHLLRLDEVSAEEQSTLRALARVQLNADGRSLAHHVKDWCELHE